jgi:hypothetical protein
MIEEIIRSNSLIIFDLRRLIEDVPEEMMTSQVGAVVNHPAWVIGHLAHSCEAIAGELGVSPWLPKGWREKFLAPAARPSSRAEAIRPRQIC